MSLQDSSAGVLEVISECQVFDQTTLEKFLSLRLQYLARLVSSACTCIPELVIKNVRPETFQMLSIWADQVHQHMDVLVPFDSVLSAADWGTKWADVLTQAESIGDLVCKVQEKLKVEVEPQPGSGSSDSKPTGAAAYMQLRKTHEAEAAEAEVTPLKALKPEAHASKAGDVARYESTTPLQETNLTIYPLD